MIGPTSAEKIRRLELQVKLLCAAMDLRPTDFDELIPQEVFDLARDGQRRPGRQGAESARVQPRGGQPRRPRDLAPPRLTCGHPAVQSSAAMPTSAPPEIFKAYDIRGLYGEQIDGDVAEAIGRAFVRVLGKLADKPPSELRVGLGRDMRLTAPELAARYRDGLTAEGAHVLDAGMVGTEMLYYLVGSRDLDGGLMCTASHNPRQYTGAKLVERGAVALSGDAGIADVRRTLEEGLGDAPGGGSVSRRSTSPRSSARRR